MFVIFQFITLALVSITIDAASNNYPIVLVHGVIGWGRDEMLGVKYWGGLHGDIEQKLVSEGHTVFTAAVGPISSNWDRACELYAQIKGGTVDYGEAHSHHHGHLRKGRTYPGLYKEWGTKDASGNIRKIHLVGHSMGGQTIRMLAQLLANGTSGAPLEESASSTLFEGGHEDWIHSITTISTPHEGTVFADGFATSGNLFKDLVLGIISLAGSIGHSTEYVYDFKLDQWGFAPRQPSESITNYVTRILTSNILQPGFKDIALYDLTMHGAQEINSWVKTQPNIYYYSYSTSDTKPSTEKIDGKFYPVQKANSFSMVIPLRPSADFIGGRYTIVDKGLGEKWEENDGAVPKISQQGALSSSIVEYDGIPKPGVWQYMPHLSQTDHLTICGMNFKDPYNVYSNHVKLLRNIPSQRSLLRGDVNSDFAMNHLRGLETTINEAINVYNREHTIIDRRRLCVSQSSDFAAKLCRRLLGIDT